MLTRYQFLCQLDAAVRDAQLNRGVRATPVCDAILRMGLPIPNPKDLADLNSPAWEKEVANDPIFAAVKAAAAPIEERASAYRLMVLAERAWEDYVLGCRARGEG